MGGIQGVRRSDSRRGSVHGGFPDWFAFGVGLEKYDVQTAKYFIGLNQC